jgi:hypothetical protein
VREGVVAYGDMILLRGLIDEHLHLCDVVLSLSTKSALGYQRANSILSIGTSCLARSYDVFVFERFPRSGQMVRRFASGFVMANTLFGDHDFVIARERCLAYFVDLLIFMITSRCEGIGLAWCTVQMCLSRSNHLSS